ncbi:MAG: DUF3987 domain-containing protein [Methylophilaceae bacterium]
MDEQEKGQTFICPPSASKEITGTTQRGVPENPENQATLNASIANNVATGFDNLPLTQSGVVGGSTCGQYTNDSSQANVALAAEQPEHLAWPPGFAGALAQFIYHSAPRPVAEVAIVGALGLLAGICGRRWVVSNTGLNLYLILVARSAIGKEAMHTGIATLVIAASKKAPDTERFVSFTDFASGPALIRAVSENNCFVNVAGEFGHKFAKMARAKEGPENTLRNVLTNLYAKSGPLSIAGGISYSDKERNTNVNAGIAYSLVGETTPSTFYDAITQDMMCDGFMSRFTVIAYEGDRPNKNPYPELIPSEKCVNHLSDIVLQAVQHDLRNHYQDVYVSTDAGLVLSAFEDECDSNIRKAGDDESRRQMWNRAHLKALRIASLLAVADNCLNPYITTVHADWAIDLVRRDIGLFSKRLNNGDIGDGDDVRQNKILALLLEYFSQDLPEAWEHLEPMKHTGIVSYNWLQNRTQRLSAFEKHPLKSTAALRQTLDSLINCGFIIEVPKLNMAERFGKQSKAYFIQDLPGYEKPAVTANWVDKFLKAAETKLR